MAIKTMESTHHRGYRVVMTICPICGYEFEPSESRADHFRNRHEPAEVSA